MAQYTITGFDASAHMAEETHQASRSAAVGMYMSVVASVVFGFILLVAVTFAVPSTDGAIENLGFIVPWIWAESMGQNWAEALLFVCVVAQFFCVTASDHVRVADALRVLARRRRARASALAAGRPQPRAAAVGRSRSSSSSAAIMVPAYWNYLVGYLVGTGIAVIGLYIAFILPVDPALPARRPLRAGRLDPREALQVDRPDRDPLGRRSSSIVFLLPPYKSSVPWADEFSWEALNYAPILVGGALLLFGGWYLLSARKWFKGPVRMGTEEELERLEEQTARGRSALPPESA